MNKGLIFCVIGWPLVICMGEEATYLLIFFYCSFCETEGRQAEPKHTRQLTTWKVFYQVERIFRSWESKCQPLPWDVDISPPSSSSLGSSWTNLIAYIIVGNSVSWATWRLKSCPRVFLIILSLLSRGPPLCGSHYFLFHFDILLRAINMGERELWASHTSIHTLHPTTEKRPWTFSRYDTWISFKFFKLRYYKSFEMNKPQTYRAGLVKLGICRIYRK